MRKYRYKLIMLSFIVLLSTLLSACSMGKLSKTDDSNRTDRILEAVIREGGTDGEKKYIANWVKDATANDENGAKYYSYFLFSNKILVKIPNNTLVAEIFTGCDVSNPTTGVYTILEYDKHYKETYKEIVQKEHFYNLAIVSHDEIIEETREEQESKEYNLDWLVFSEEEIDNMPFKELKSAYKNLRLFESYYRYEVVKEIILDSTAEMDYKQIISFKDAFNKGSYDDTIESLLFNAYSGKKDFKEWVEKFQSFNEIKKEKSKTISKKKATKIMKKYLKNAYIQDNVIIFKDKNLFFDIDYLDKDLGIIKQDIRDTQHIDANNRERVR